MVSRGAGYACQMLSVRQLD